MKLINNPIFIGLLLVVGGGIIGAIGWDKNESTIPARTHGSEVMMWGGVVMAIAGLLIWFVLGNRRK